MPRTELDFGDDFTPAPEVAAPAAPAPVAPVAPAAGDDDDDLFAQETEEERAEREAEEAAAALARTVRIPKERHDAAVAAERARAEAAEARAAALEQRLQEAAAIPAPQPQAAEGPTEAQVRTFISQQQDKYEELLADGLTAEAKLIRNEIEQARDYLLDMRTQRLAADTRDSTLTALKYESTLTALETAYPQLNPDDPTYDLGTATRVAELMAKFMTAGDSQVDALVEATKLVLGNVTRAPAAPAVPAPPAAPSLRTAEARRNAAKVLAAQPASHDLSGKTAVPPTVSVKNMSFKAFSELDETTLAKLRGDEL